MMRPVAPLTHELTIDHDPPYAWASCSCGWSAEESPSLHEAREAAHRHAPGARVSVEEPPEADPATLGHAFASERVWTRGEPIRVMYREQSREPEDSGWRVYSGMESTSDAAQFDGLVPVEITELIERDAHVSTIIHTEAPCAFERETAGQPFRRTELKYKGTAAD